MPCEHIMCFAATKRLMDYEVVPIEHLTLTLKKQYPQDIRFERVSSTEAKSRTPNNALRIALLAQGKLDDRIKGEFQQH